MKPRRRWPIKTSRSEMPSLPPSPEVDISASGRARFASRWAAWRWLVYIPLGIAGIVLFYPILWGPVGFLALAAVLAWLIYRTWHP